MDEEIIKASEIYYYEAIEVYNRKYGRDYNFENEQAFIVAYIVTVLYGTRRGTESADDPVIRELITANFGADYEGVYATTDRQLEQLLENGGEEADLVEFWDARAVVIATALVVGIFQSTQLYLGIKDNKRYVGGITRGDDRVRPKHREHDRRFFEEGSRTPMLDYRCRCRYEYFDTKEDAINAGYEPI